MKSTPITPRSLSARPPNQLDAYNRTWNSYLNHEKHRLDWQQSKALLHFTSNLCGIVLIPDQSQEKRDDDHTS